MISEQPPVLGLAGTALAFWVEGGRSRAVPSALSPRRDGQGQAPALHGAGSGCSCHRQGQGGSGVPSALEGRGRCKPGGEGAAGSPWGLLQEEEGRDDSDALELYQQSLGELLLLLAGELGLGPGSQGGDGSRSRPSARGTFPPQRSRRGGGGSCSMPR